MHSTVGMQDTTESELVGYALLVLPPKKELRKKGYHVESIHTTSHRDHPLAKWSTYTLKKGSTYRDALDAIEEANKDAWGLLKARINFACGSFDTYARLNPNDPITLKHTGTYDPNGVYKSVTVEAATVGRTRLLPRLRPLVDERGHHTCARPLPRTFAPQVMYKDAPPPVLTQAGYDFTPVSHTAFLLRSADPPQGVRDVKSDFTKNSCDYRPRSYLRDEVGGGVNSRHCHCAEVYQVGDYTVDLARNTDTVNHRNRLVTKEFTSTGTLKPSSTVVGRRHAKVPRFPCAHHTKGGATQDTANVKDASATDPRGHDATDLTATATAAGAAIVDQTPEQETPERAKPRLPAEARSVHFREQGATVA